MSELKGPSIFELKQFIKEKSTIEFHTSDYRTIRGQIMWFDESAFHLNLDSGQEITLLKSFVIYYNKQLEE